tara:strand:+ start:799 stop:1506 length:708 start_codon:yes stop_codon:yes gene_type:complete
MSLFNTPVCVAVDHKYSDNNGAWTEFTFFDGVSFTSKGGMYSNIGYDSFKVNATPKQLRKASLIALERAPEGYCYNKYAGNGGANTYVGCLVKLSRSRKAPNKTELTVLEWFDGGYNSQLNNYTPDQISVTDGVNTWVVSASCIKEVIKGVKEKPFWYISANELSHLLIANNKRRVRKAVASYNTAIINKINNLLISLGDKLKDYTAKELTTACKPDQIMTDKLNKFKLKYSDLV